VVLQNLDAVEAMKRSFSGCLRNVLPFLLFGLLLLPLSLLGLITLGLGLLVVVPIIYAATYAAYRDIFLAP